MTWRSRSHKENEATIAIWFDAMAPYDIPVDCYKPLLNRAIDRRQQIVRDLGPDKAPAIDAPLLISCWTGQNGMKADLERERIASGRFLPPTAASTCPRCYGTGFEEKYDIDGKKLGVKPGCKHEPLVETEWLFKSKNSDKKEAAGNVVEGKF